MTAHPLRASVLVLAIATLVPTLGACLPSSPYDDQCGGASYRAEWRDLEDDLRTLAGGSLTFVASKPGGTLEVTLTIDEVSDTYARAPNTTLFRIANLATDLIVPHAHASCSMPSASSNATYTATWTPMGGGEATVRQEGTAYTSYQNGNRGYYAPEGWRVLFVRSRGFLMRFETPSDASSLTLADFDDPDHPDSGFTAPQ